MSMELVRSSEDSESYKTSLYKEIWANKILEIPEFCFVELSIWELWAII
jgi:hypothetical protein